MWEDDELLAALGPEDTGEQEQGEYGNLTEDELLMFLSEIKDDDDNMLEEQKDDEGAAAIASAQRDDDSSGGAELSDEQFREAVTQDGFLEEDKENAAIEALYGDDGEAWNYYNSQGDVVLTDQEQRQERSEAFRKRAHLHAANTNIEKAKIRREAFRQTDICLSDAIESEDIKLLITLLTKELTRLIDRQEAFINKRLSHLLLPFMPRRLRICKRLYPQSVRKCQGFLYKSYSDVYGRYTFWAKPDIPYYLPQNTECSKIKERRPDLLLAVDRAIYFYNKYYKLRAEKEIKYSTIIIQKHISRYFDLLKYNPFWFDCLYKAIMEERNAKRHNI